MSEKFEQQNYPQPNNEPSAQPNSTPQMQNMQPEQPAPQQNAQPQETEWNASSHQPTSTPQMQNMQPEQPAPQQNAQPQETEWNASSHQPTSTPQMQNMQPEQPAPQQNAQPQETEWNASSHQPTSTPQMQNMQPEQPAPQQNAQPQETEWNASSHQPTSTPQMQNMQPEQPAPQQNAQPQETEWNASSHQPQTNAGQPDMHQQHRWNNQMQGAYNPYTQPGAADHVNAQEAAQHQQPARQNAAAGPAQPNWRQDGQGHDGHNGVHACGTYSQGDEIQQHQPAQQAADTEKSEDWTQMAHQQNAWYQNGAGAEQPSPDYHYDTEGWESEYYEVPNFDAQVQADSQQTGTKKESKHSISHFWSGKKKTVIKCAAGLVAVGVISVGSVGAYVAMSNAGWLPAPNSSSGFSLNNVPTTNTSSNSGEQLTAQQVAAKVIPSVVCIQNFQSNSVQAAGEGSGIIMTADGYIITNAHVVSGATSLKVVLSDGGTYEAKLVGSDTATDLALIKIEATGLTAAEFGNSDQLEVAESVMAIGNPGGMEFNSSVTNGIISAVNRPITNDTGYTMDCIQTNAAINPGNSGGALVNMYGQVIGINSSKIVATGYEGLGFAISINDAQPIISDLKEYGYVKNRVSLGITYQNIDEMVSQFYRLPTGVYVQSITDQRTASAGLKQGDVITKADGEEITTGTELHALLMKKKPGDTIKLTVYRSSDGQTYELEITLYEYEASNNTQNGSGDGTQGGNEYYNGGQDGYGNDQGGTMPFGF